MEQAGLEHLLLAGTGDGRMCWGEIFLAALVVFFQLSVRTVPHTDIFFDMFMVGGELHVYLFRHLDPSPLSAF